MTDATTSLHAEILVMYAVGSCIERKTLIPEAHAAVLPTAKRNDFIDQLEYSCLRFAIDNPNNDMQMI